MSLNYLTRPIDQSFGTLVRILWLGRPNSGIAGSNRGTRHGTTYSNLCTYRAHGDAYFD